MLLKELETIYGDKVFINTDQILYIENGDENITRIFLNSYTKLSYGMSPVLVKGNAKAIADYLNSK